MADDQRYRKLGLMVGLELHQQLNTSRKLFCHCPTEIRDDSPHGKLIRRLRPTQSEMGEVDPAALFEFQRQKHFCYEYYNDTTCLVETDEEPPHNLSDEAIDVCLVMANFLGSRPVDEVHSMRKIVIDGSNTTGFQRTVIVANGGSIDVGDKEIGIQSLSLEEDAARKISDDDKNNMRVYRLDRLGIPLIEVATAPDIRTPFQAQEVALAIGKLLRSTGRVKRGLGTIRQDVNVSIAGGAITEIKGFQQLDMLSTLVEMEALRQEKLLQIRDTLHDLGVEPDDIKHDLVKATKAFASCESKVVAQAIKSGGEVYAVCLKGFDGLMGTEVQPNRRLGTELSDYAKFWGGVGGIFHTDELPKYGITESEVRALRELTKAQTGDAVVMVAASEQNCKNALKAVVDRAREAVIGVPAETRAPLPDGTSKYARPRPGASRMYPETDVRPVKITAAWLKRIKKEMPETLEEKGVRFVKEYGLSTELASQVTNSYNVDLFEHLVKTTGVLPTIVATTLENTLVSLSREGVPVDNISDQHYEVLFAKVNDNTLAQDAIPTVLACLANNPQFSIDEAIDLTGLGMLSEREVQVVVARIVADRASFVMEQGERAVGGIMGVAMKELRGKADGKLVRDIIAAEVQRVLNSATER